MYEKDIVCHFGIFNGGSFLSYKENILHPYKLKSPTIKNTKVTNDIFFIHLFHLYKF